MADWSVEIAAAWTPCDLQWVNWTMEPAVCSPFSHTVEDACTEKFGDCLQTSVPVFEGGQVVVADNGTCLRALRVVQDKYKVDISKTQKRYPASIQALHLSERYTVPMVVAIGPCYHDTDKLQPTEKVKHVAAYNLVTYSDYTIDTVYRAVVAEAHEAHKLYEYDVVEGMDIVKHFQPMMFFDACFLVQYMRCMSDTKAQMDDSLRQFFHSNDEEIFHDIMLLENQLPWPVVQAIMKFVPLPLETFIRDLKSCLHDRKGHVDETFIMEEYEPPHLLGLIRYYIVGETKKKTETKPDTAIFFSLGAIELAEMGIKLKPSKTTELVHMGLESEGNFFAELSLAPLSLNSSRESWLINMAALELCTTPNFGAADDKESAVCSYLLLIAMLVGREEDVQELRARGILQGGGFTNQEALDFFKNVQGLRLGSCYLRVMKDIKNYRVKKRRRANLHTIYYRNFNFLAGLVSSIATIITIIGTYLALKK